MPSKANHKPHHKTLADEMKASGAMLFTVEVEELKPIEPATAKAFWKAHKDEIAPILGPEESDKFWCIEQVEALKILGASRVDLALKFITSNSLEALKILGPEHGKLALKFIVNDPALKALKILGPSKVDVALKFDFIATNKVRVLEILGPEHVEFALNSDFSDLEVRSLEVLGLQKAHLANSFRNYISLQALWILGRDRAEVAVNIREYPKLYSLLDEEMQNPANATAICNKFHKEQEENKLDQSLLKVDSFYSDKSIVEKVQEHCQNYPLKAKTSDPLKAILVLGPSVEIHKELAELYTQEGYLMIEINSLRDLEQLQGKIGPYTRIDLNFHGELHYNARHEKETHHIKLVTKKIYSGIFADKEIMISIDELFDKFAALANNDPLHLHVWGCYSGKALQESNHLPKDSVVIVHNYPPHESLRGIDDMAAWASVNTLQEYNLEPNLHDIFQGFLYNLNVYLVQGVGLSYVLSSNSTSNFVVPYNISNLLELEEPFLQTQMTQFKDFINPIYNSESLTFEMEDDKEYVEEVFCYNIFTGDNQTVAFLNKYSGRYEHLVNVNCSWSDLFPLYLATLKERKNIVELLLENGADPNKHKADKTEETPLYIAGVMKNTEIASLLLKHGAKAIQLGSENIIAMTLSVMSMWGAVDSLRAAIVDMKKASEPTFASIISDAIKLANLRSLVGEVNYKSDLSLSFGAALNWENHDHKTPLYLAAEGGHAETVTILLDAGAGVDGLFLLQTLSRPPLCGAIINGYIKIAEILLDRGANINVKCSYEDDFFPQDSVLFTAAYKQNIPIVQLLLDRGANHIVSDGNPLSVAKDDAMIELLLDAGVDPNGHNLFHRSPIEDAIYAHDAKKLELLLSRSADPNGATNIFRETLLELAIRNSDQEVVKVLLNNGADPTGVKRQGHNDQQHDKISPLLKIAEDFESTNQLCCHRCNLFSNYKEENVSSSKDAHTECINAISADDNVECAGVN